MGREKMERPAGMRDAGWLHLAQRRIHLDAVALFAMFTT
jgi:hypothetical protein